MKNAHKAEVIAAVCAMLLAIGKLLFFFSTGSLVIALSALDSSIDAGVSLLNQKIIKFARLDADHNHPYGHGRAESIAALGQGALIMGGAIAVVVSGCRHLYNQPLVIDNFSWSLVLFFGAAAVVSMVLAQWLKQQGIKYHSTALAADSVHYQTDVVVNIATALSIGLVIYFQKSFLDPLVAIIFSLYIMRSAYKLISTSINELMDHDIPSNIKDLAKKTILGTTPAIIDVHNFRGRKSGHRYFFDFHVTFPDKSTFLEVHTLVEEIEHNLRRQFDCDVFVHTDPEQVRYKHAHD